MQTLDSLLHSGEWTGAEFKAARTALPKSVFESVSAFANTRGGWLVLGITQQGEHFEVTGVAEPDKIQNDFLSVLHADDKVNHDVEVTERRYLHEDKVVLAFHIAENSRTRKRIGMCEQAGTGLRIMRREWWALGHAEPTHSNDRACKAFELFLPDLTRAAMKATPEVTPEVAKLIMILEGAMGRAELMAALGLKDEKHFREHYQQTAMSLELIEMTIPDRPRSSKQRYRLTELGSRLKATLMGLPKKKGLE